MTGTAPGGETQALWQEYRATRDRALRDRLILTYAPLVKFVAGRLGSSLPSHVDEQDLVSYGLLGLIGAIERFDPDREIKFETYAIARIKGAIIDELRSLDWVPRSVRAARAGDRARDRRAGADADARADRRGDRGEDRHHRGRARDEPLRHLALVDGGARRALERRRAAATRSRSSTRSRTPRAPDPEFSLEQTELNEALAEAIARLPGAREARRHALLLRGADAAGDRRGARGHGVARLAAPHEGRAPPQGAARRRRPRHGRHVALARDLDGEASSGRSRRRRAETSIVRSRVRHVREDERLTRVDLGPRRPRRRRARTSTWPPHRPSGEVSVVLSARRAPAGTTIGCGVASSVLSIDDERFPARRARDHDRHVRAERRARARRWPGAEHGAVLDAGVGTLLDDGREAARPGAPARRRRRSVLERRARVASAGPSRRRARRARGASRCVPACGSVATACHGWISVDGA